MPQKLVVPKFASEAEEAQWWFDNQDLLAEEFELAGKEGRLGHGRAIQRALAASESVRPNPEDVELARKQAASDGIEYQDYLKRVIHEAVAGREKRA